MQQAMVVVVAVLVIKYGGWIRTEYQNHGVLLFILQQKHSQKLIVYIIKKLIKYQMIFVFVYKTLKSVRLAVLRVLIK